MSFVEMHLDTLFSLSHGNDLDVSSQTRHGLNRRTQNPLRRTGIYCNNHPFRHSRRGRWAMFIVYHEIRPGFDSRTIQKLVTQSRFGDRRCTGPMHPHGPICVVPEFRLGMGSRQGTLPSEKNVPHGGHMHKLKRMDSGLWCPCASAGVHDHLA